MAQYTVFYKDDAEKEIQQAYNGVCEDSDFIAHFTDLGCKNILVECAGYSKYALLYK